MTTPVVLSRSQLGQVTKIAGGGQGYVFTAPRVRLEHVTAAVFKEYKPEWLSKIHAGVLARMTQYLMSLSHAEGVRLIERAAWPLRLVTGDDGSICGFIMPKVPDAFFLQLRLASGPKRSLGQMQHIINNDAFIANRGIALTEQHRYQLLADTAQTLQLLHSHGVAVGDVSPKNLVFSLRPTARVYFIDCDAMRFAGASVLPQVETPDWDVGAVSDEQLATPRSDAYKLGLLALRLLVGDAQTRNVATLPLTVPPQVRRLITASLAADPKKRPAPRDWPTPLTAAASIADTALVQAPRQPVTPRQPPPRHHRAAPAARATPAVAPAPPSPPSTTTSKHPGRQAPSWRWVKPLLVLGAIVVALGAVGSIDVDDTNASPDVVTRKDADDIAPRASAPSPNTWVVQLASVPHDDSRQAAEVKASAVPGASVLDSDDYKSLRPGYWVVYRDDSYQSGHAALRYCERSNRTMPDDCLGRFLSNNRDDRRLQCFRRPGGRLSGGCSE